MSFKNIETITINGALPITPLNIVLPYSMWQNGSGAFITTVNGVGVGTWVNTDVPNGVPFAGLPNIDYGSVPFIAPTNGVYQFMIAFQAGANTGIIRVVINGIETLIDCYDALSQNIDSYVWNQNLTAGTHNINIDSLTKNPASSNYYISFYWAGLTINQIS